MKKLLVLVVIILFITGCKKEHDTPSSSKRLDDKNLQNVPKCGNDLNPEFATKMMKARRSRDEQEIVSQREPKDTPDPTLSPTVILVDADGHTLENTIWNWDGPLHCRTAALTPDQMNAIVKSVTEDFSTFDVVVTDDENVYNKAPKGKRVRVIVTTHEGLENFFPNFGGYAFIGSLWWGDDTPCFVFADAFAGNALNIAEVVSHEAGHTIGLAHQSEFSFDGRFLFEYHRGFFSQPWNLSWKPIMGVSYNSNISGWMWGRNLGGLQDDTKILSAVGSKNDEMPALGSGAEEIKVNGSGKAAAVTGLMNHRNDIDYYFIKSGDIAFSVVGGGNTDLTVFVYDHNEQLIAEYNDHDNLGISEKTINTKGNRIYIKVLVNGLLIGDVSSEMQFAGQYTLLVNKI